MQSKQFSTTELYFQPFISNILGCWFIFAFHSDACWLWFSRYIYGMLSPFYPLYGAISRRARTHARAFLNIFITHRIWFSRFFIFMSFSMENCNLISPFEDKEKYSFVWKYIYLYYTYRFLQQGNEGNKKNVEEKNLCAHFMWWRCCCFPTVKIKQDLIYYKTEMNTHTIKIRNETK